MSPVTSEDIFELLLKSIIREDYCMLNNIEKMKGFWHSSSQIMAQGVKRLYPEAKLAIGDASENGFYYDIDLEVTITEDILQNIEIEMKKIIKENYRIEKFKLTKYEAVKLMDERGENYKIELINDMPIDEDIFFYKQGEFIDLWKLFCNKEILNIKKTLVELNFMVQQ